MSQEQKRLWQFSKRYLCSNSEKVGKEFKVLIDRKEGNFFIGRTEFDSPDDNEVLIDAGKHFVRRNFVQVKVFEASDYDLFAEPV